LENSWLPEKELTNAKELLDQFKQKHNSRQGISTLALQAQQRPKEGILSWMQSTTSSITSSKSKVPQVNPIIRPAHDPEKQETRAKPSGDLVSRDRISNRSPDPSRVLSRDRISNRSPDPSRVLSRDKSRDSIQFGWARSPLINKWQTVGTVHNQ